MKPVLTLIAAMDGNRLLADERGIPWRLPQDTAHFREYTLNKCLLLGRRTYEEMRGWFREGHTPLVLSAQCGWDPSIGRLVSSVPHALALAESVGQAEVVCCGGAQTYATALPYADRLVLTRVHHEFPAARGAVFFPEWNPAEWHEVQEKKFQQDAKHAHAFTIRWMERR